MVDMTSSISRPFTAPKPIINSAGSTGSNKLTDSNSAQSWHDAKQLFGEKQDIKSAFFNGESGEMSVVEFPAVARRVLDASDVLKLYSYIRQLHAGDDVDAVIRKICLLLRDPACRELLDLMPTVLSGKMGSRFIKEARHHGLLVSVDAKYQRMSAPGRPADMSMYFEGLQQKKRKTQDRPATTGAVVKDPQCFVCYDITRKAFASPLCGHICCQFCWKKMEKNGFTSCPVCKIPIKLQQLSLIRAATHLTGHPDKVDEQ